MEEIASQIPQAIRYISPLIAGVLTGLFVALLIELIRHIKGRIARRRSIAIIRVSILEMLSMVENDSPLEKLEFGKFYYRLVALKSMVDVQSRNLTAREHYEIGHAVAGFLDLADTFRRDMNLPRKDYYNLFTKALKGIKWLDMDK